MKGSRTNWHRISWTWWPRIIETRASCKVSSPMVATCHNQETMRREGRMQELCVESPIHELVNPSNNRGSSFVIMFLVRDVWIGLSSKVGRKTWQQNRRPTKKPHRFVNRSVRRNSISKLYMFRIKGNTVSYCLYKKSKRFCVEISELYPFSFQLSLSTLRTLVGN